MGRITDPRKKPSVSHHSVEVDLESESSNAKIDSGKIERICRICHLSLEGNQESGIPIEIGCSCKDDLAVAHKQCAETWFKIKGDKICEICGVLASNLVVPNENELTEHELNITMTEVSPTSETRHFWQGHRVLNFLLVCMVLAFVISWLFHFNAPS